jgi:hypothetical protein
LSKTFGYKKNIPSSVVRFRREKENRVEFVFERMPTFDDVRMPLRMTNSLPTGSRHERCFDAKNSEEYSVIEGIVLRK